MKKTLILMTATILLHMGLAAQTIDTLKCGGRQPNYYYSEWYDTTDWYNHRDTLRGPELTGFSSIGYTWVPGGGTFQVVQQYVPVPIRVRGLWAMVSQDSEGNPEEYHSYRWPVLDSTRLPEYLYLYVRDSVIEYDSLDTTRFLRRIATVRWDTLQPKMLCLQRTYDANQKAYIHIYEMDLDTAVVLQGEFWIGGTRNSTSLHNTGPLPHGHYHFPTYYYGWGQFPDWNNVYNPDKNKVTALGPDGPFWGMEHWFPYGPFGVITEGLRHMEVGAANPVEGTVDWTAYYPDSSYQTITAVPGCGYRFSHWNDGDTSNPRVVFVTQDTTFSAYFDSVGQYLVTVRSDNGERGEAVLIVRRNDPEPIPYPVGEAEFRPVGGDSSYCYGHNAIMRARAHEGFIFVSWNDGVTDNPRWVRVTQDTVFTAHFSSLTQYRVEVRSNDDALGYTTGDSVYGAGDEAVIGAVPLGDSSYFAMWNDGVTDNPRRVRVIQDTVFTAHFGSLTQCRVEVRSNDDALGYTTGDSVYNAGDEAVISAVPLGDRAYFVMWDDEVTDNPRMLVVTHDTAFTAVFMEAEDTGHVGIAPVGGATFTLQPNPTDGEVRVETAGEAFPGGVLAVTDASGREVQRHELAPHTGSVRLDLSALPQGTYFVTLRTEEGSSTKKLVLK